MRLFTAVLFDDDTLDRISLIRDRLHDEAATGSFARRDNLHLTLDFLGECSVQQMHSAQAAMDEISFEPFDIMFDRTGFFAGDSSDTWWLGVRENRNLMKLQAALHEALIEKGLKLEKRRYRPHVTLARRVITSSPAGPVEPFKTTVSAVSLMLSERHGNSMVYTNLYTVNGYENK